MRLFVVTGIQELGWFLLNAVVMTVVALLFCVGMMCQVIGGILLSANQRGMQPAAATVKERLSRASVERRAAFVKTLFDFKLRRVKRMIANLEKQILS